MTNECNTNSARMESSMMGAWVWDSGCAELLTPAAAATHKTGTRARSWPGDARDLSRGGQTKSKVSRE